MKSVVNSSKKWTFGAEHELGDFDQRQGLFPGWKLDRRDVTMMNHNGVAVDPKGRVWPFGGELNTPPTDTPAGQVELLEKFLKKFPEARVNHRSNLHVHVRVPGLKENLPMLKELQAYVREELPKVLELIEPIPRPTPSAYPQIGAYEGALRRYRRRKVSHHTLLPDKRVEVMLMARTCKEFFNLEPPQSREGKPLWHCQPRAAVNLRQLLETDTVEFRHFPGTLDSEELYNCIAWCRDFLFSALDGFSAAKLWQERFRGKKFPRFPKYFHWRECNYRKTVHDGTVPKAQIVENIAWITGLEYRGGKLVKV